MNILLNTYVLQCVLYASERSYFQIYGALQIQIIIIIISGCRVNSDLVSHNWTVDDLKENNVANVNSRKSGTSSFRARTSKRCPCT